MMLDLDHRDGKNANGTRTFLSFFPSLLSIFVSLETGESEKLSLKLPSNVVEGSARATYAVLGESPIPKEVSVHPFNSSPWGLLIPS